MVSVTVRDGWSSMASTVGGLKSDRVSALLEQQILSGELQAGHLLPPEPELSELLGVSRTVLRDAVRALVAKGLLTVRQGRGTVVAEPSDEAFATAMVALLARSALTVGDVMKARIPIERMIVRLAAEAGTQEDWRALEDAEKALIDAIAATDYVAAHQAHAAFHAGILNATHQPALVLILNPMNQIALLTGTTSVRQGTMEDWDLQAHRTILDALRLRNADAAEEAMCLHFAGVASSPIYLGLLDKPFAQAYFNTP